MGKIFFLLSCAVLLTGCVVAPDDGYTYHSNAGYYEPVHYDTYYRNRKNYRDRPSRTDFDYSRRPPSDKMKYDHHRPLPLNELSYGQHRPMPPQGPYGQQRPMPPQDMHDQKRPQWNQQQGRPMNIKPSMNRPNFQKPDNQQ